MNWRWNTRITRPGHYWVSHDHWNDAAEPDVIRVFEDLDGELSYFRLDGRPASKLGNGGTDSSDFNYWLPLETVAPFDYGAVGTPVEEFVP